MYVSVAFSIILRVFMGYNLLLKSSVFFVTYITSPMLSLN